MGGQSRNNLAAVDATSGALRPWNPGADGTVSTLDASPDGSTVYVGGAFTRLAGQQQPHLGAVSATTGQLLTSFDAGVDGPVSDVELTDSSVYVAGTFANAGGSPRSNLAALDASTGVASSWAPVVSGPVKALP